MGTIFMMYHFVGAPVLQLVQGQAIILEELAIDGFDLAIRGEDPNETGYPVNCRAQASLAFTQRLLRTFALGQIEYERNDLVTSFLEQRCANKHRHATAVISKILLLEGLNGSGRVQFCPDTFVLLTPLRRGQV